MSNKVNLLEKDFHFGIGFLNELIDGTGIPFEELMHKSEVELTPKSIYYSLMYSYKRNQKEVDFTMYDVNDWIDENGGVGGSFWTAFNKAFSDSIYKDVPTDNSKKKATVAK